MNITYSVYLTVTTGGDRWRGDDR